MMQSSIVDPLHTIKDSDLESAFRNVLKSLHIPDKRWDEFLQQPKQVKWNMICTHKNLRKSYGRVDASPGGIATELMELSKQVNLNLQALVDVRVRLYPQSSRGQFVSEFLKVGGIDQVLRLLQRCVPRSQPAQSSQTEHAKAKLIREQLECLKLVKCCMNSSRSLERIISTPESVDTIALYFNLENVEVTSIVLEILTVIALFSCDGHNQVILAMESYRVTMREPLRFYSVVECIKSDNNAKHSMGFKALVLSFVNTIINSAVCIEDRVAIRADFIYLGIVDTLEDFEGVYEYMSCENTGTMRGKGSGLGSTFHEELEALMTQIQVFHSTADGDNVQILNTVEIDVSNPRKVFECVLASAVESGCAQELLEVLQSLLLVSGDSNAASSTWDLLVEHTQRIVAMPGQLDESFLTFEDIATRLETLKNRNEQKQLAKDSTSTKDMKSLDVLKVTEELNVVLERNKELEQRVKSTQEAFETDRSKLSQKIETLSGQLKTVQAELEKEKNSTHSPMSTTSAMETKVTPQIDPAFEKYLRMKRAGLPEGAIRNAAVRDSLDEDEVIKQIELALASPQQSVEKVSQNLDTPHDDTSETVEEDPLHKYRKMLKAGLPHGAILHKMTNDGIENASLELLATQEKESGDANALTDPLEILLSNPDEKYDRYRKMKAAGLPVGAIHNALARDSIELPKVPSTKFAKPLENTVTSKPVFLTSSDPKYKKYQNMVAAGLPMGAVENAMQRDNIDVAVALHGTSSQMPPVIVSKKPKKQVPQSSVPLRALFWNKVPDSDVDETMWKDLTDSHIALDLKSIEKNFSKRTSNILSKRESDGPTPIPPGHGKKTLQILDGKRTQNVAIAIARLRMTPEQIKDAVLEVDEEQLGGSKGSEDQVVLVQRVMPTEEEVELIKSHNMEDLGKVEKHFLVMASIPRYSTRLEAWRLMLRFDHVCAECDYEMGIVDTAISQVRTAESWKRTMEVILAIGNFLNGPTARGGAYGFRLDVLPKLKTIKTMDNKGNLLQYIAQEVAVKHHREMLELGTELSGMEVASHTSLSDLQDGVRGLEKAAKFVSTELEFLRRHEENTPDDKFVIKMIPFLTRAEKAVEKYGNRMEALNASYENLKLELGEPKTSSSYSDSSELFGLIRTFVADFMKEATSSPLYGQGPSAQLEDLATEYEDFQSSEDESDSASSSSSSSTSSNSESELDDARSGSRTPKSLFELVRAARSSMGHEEEDDAKAIDDCDGEWEGQDERSSARRKSASSEQSGSSNASRVSNQEAHVRAAELAKPKNAKQTMFDRVLSTAQSGGANDIIQQFAKRRSSSMASGRPTMATTGETTSLRRRSSSVATSGVENHETK